MKTREELNLLAKSHGVQTSYVDMTGRTRHASLEALMAVLRALGAPVSSLRKDGSRSFRRAKRGEISGLKRDFSASPRNDGKWSHYRKDDSVPAIRTPRTCFGAGDRKRSWGLFLPLYALWSERNPGAGDLTDLKNFARWAGGLGAAWVGTLPLLSQFLDKPFDPSPYSPASRLFWSEFWLDLGEIKGLPRGRQVDYRRQMRLKREILEKRAARWLPPAAWLREHPETLEYARFRAAAEQRGAWRRWPDRMRRGDLRAGEISERIARVHLYGQWLAGRQMGDLRRAAAAAGTGLYFDLPLGVHPDGYDAWKEQDLFVEGATVGAPPDPFFSGGQNWGFHPIHPERIRQQGYGYWRRCLAHSMRFASMLRVDHVMGLHRLFWIPKGFPASEGVYVRYPAEELYAVLAQESRRNRCAVVGEDLGIVPPEVCRAMRRHRLSGMFVVQYEWRPDSRRPFRAPPRRSVACLNTHDMPPFAAFWRKRKRAGGAGAVETARALLRRLAAGPVRDLQVNPEDLWGERRPHNRPGTVGKANWRRKALVSLEQMRSMKEMTRFFKEIKQLRARS